MAFHEDRGERKTFSGNWTCADCGAAITELPFEPRSTDGLQCRDCHKNSRPARRPVRERKMFSGNWTCSACGKAITELPFEPRSTEGLECSDCHRNSRMAA